MQWDGSQQAGFTTGRPWLPIGRQYAELNAAREAGDPRSLLSLYKRLIGLRRSSAALALGSCALLEAQTPGCLAYERMAKREDGTTERMLTIVNFTEKEVDVSLPEHVRKGRLLLSTHPAGDEMPETMRLAPNEGRLLQILSSMADS